MKDCLRSHKKILIAFTLQFSLPFSISAYIGSKMRPLEEIAENNQKLAQENQMLKKQLEENNNFISILSEYDDLLTLNRKAKDSFLIHIDSLHKKYIVGNKDVNSPEYYEAIQQIYHDKTAIININSELEKLKEEIKETLSKRGVKTQ